MTESVSEDFIFVFVFLIMKLEEGRRRHGQGKRIMTCEKEGLGCNNGLPQYSLHFNVSC